MNKDEAKVYLDNIKIAYGVTQAEIAYKIGINRQYINAVYNGKKELSTKTIHQLQQVFPDVDITSNLPTVAIPYNDKVIYMDTTILPDYIDYKDCIFIDVSGNSMSPEYKDSDKVLVNKYDNKFTDGNIYVFTVDKTTYIRLINITPTQIKCIALNKEFDTFYLDKDIEVNILGAVIPRIRL